MSDAWALEGAAIGEGDEVANSLAARILLIQAGVIDPADLASVLAYTEKIDDAAADGLAGTANSLAYMIKELERHFHNRERWWGSNGAATETNAIAATVTAPFVATSGNNTWGAAIPICGAADSPVPSPDDAKFDCHRVFVTDLSNNTTTWRLRIIWGTGTSADAIAAGQWTEMMLMSNAVPGNRAGGMPIDVIMRRVDVGAKLWAQCWNVTNALTMSFLWGAHGYSG